MRQFALQICHQSGDDLAEIADKMQRILEFMRDAGRQFTQTGECLLTHQTGLRARVTCQPSPARSGWSGVIRPCAGPRRAQRRVLLA